MTLPQILPTIGVVVTTLIVTVMKVFDIVKVTTGGQFGTQVIAYQMIDAISFAQLRARRDAGDGVVHRDPAGDVYNIRRMQQAKG